MYMHKLVESCEISETLFSSSVDMEFVDCKENEELSATEWKASSIKIVL